ncbi:hypothetical protein IRJ34_17415 [Paenarthrobacter sp. GOM3]|uniref:hypothetical protein n=1 Tax=Paenarthrobacter sp. GOM3 TaxID=2782567 RepID=UPI001BACEDC8|nr:hypothetical protein [Paenarthrobacter sp. GOM3]WOH18112.1 hypothetical protein IRJ34_17415 [Paenarthrobacter sp. GOM3]
MRRTAQQNLRLAAALLGCAAAISSCATTPDGPTRKPSSAPPVTAAPASLAESTTKYDALTKELVEALEAKMPGITWAPDDPISVTNTKDGTCIFHPQSMKSSADIVEPSKNFEAVFDAADPILEKHGFPAFGGTDPVPGGWVVARSTDGTGATITIESKSPAFLSMTVPVTAESCAGTATPTG